jgi:hypothetical protein
LSRRFINASQRRGLPRRLRIEFRRQACQKGRAGPHQPGPFSQPGLVIEEFETGAKHGPAGDDHVDMPGNRAHAGIGGGDQRAARPLVAGPHASSAFGEILHIRLGEAVPHVPHQHAIPVGREQRHRIGITDVDMRQCRGRADEPHVGPPSLLDEVARGGLPQSHAVEAERGEPLERLAVVIDRPGKERQPTHFEHASIEAACRILRGRLDRRRRIGCRDGSDRLHGRIMTTPAVVGGAVDDTLHAEIVDGHVVAARRGIEFEHDVRDHGAGEAAMGAVLGAEGRQLSLECGRHTCHRETLPAVGRLRAPPRHEHLDRPTGPGFRKLGKLDLRSDPDVGAIRPHPGFGCEFIDHPRLPDRNFHGERRTGRGIDDEPFSGSATPGRGRTSFVGQHSRGSVGGGEGPGGLRAIARILDHGGSPARRSGGPSRGQREGQRGAGNRQRNMGGGHGGGPGTRAGRASTTPCGTGSRSAWTFLPRFPVLGSFSPCGQPTIVQSERSVSYL